MLAYADLQMGICFRTRGRLPAYRGTTLRGALGYCLKHVVCHVGKRSCDTCFLRSRCAYPAVFEGLAPLGRTVMTKYPYVPQPFVLEIGDREPTEIAPGVEYQFAVRLFGPAIEFYPYVVLALMEAGQQGLGRDRVQFEVRFVDDGERRIFCATNQAEILPPAVRRLPVAAEGTRDRGIMRMNCVTPLRIRTDGRVNTTPDLAAVIRNAVRRLRMLTHFYGDGDGFSEDVGLLLAAAARANVIERALRCVAIERYSTRQRRAMSLTGTVGHLIFETDSEALKTLLRQAVICHVGKATSFGFGRIELKVERA